jgi:ATP-dependent DNA helicase RecG
MAPIVSGVKKTREAELSALRRAIEVERRTYYSDFQGKHSTFSQFMRTTADRLCRRYPTDPIWATVRGLFRQYPNLDVATRISIIKRAEDLLKPLWDVADATSSPANIGAPVTTTGAFSDQVNRGTADSLSGASTGASNDNPADVTSESPEALTQKLADSISAIREKQARATGTGADKIGESSNSAVSSTKASAPIVDSKHSGKQKEKSANQKFTVSDPNQIPVQFVRGVGPKAAAVLSKLNIITVNDLLRHYPRRHLDFQNRVFIRGLQPGQEVTIYGVIKSVGAYQAKRGNVSIVTILINDGTGTIAVTRFIGGKQNKYLLDRFKGQYPRDSQVLASGIVERDNYSNKLVLKNAEIELLGQVGDGEGEDSDSPDLSTSIHAGRLVPVYPLTEGMSLRYMRNIIHNALESLPVVSDPLPEDVKSKFDLAELDWSLRAIHFPDDVESKDRARYRLVFDEFFAIQLELAHRRHKFEQSEGALKLEFKPDGLVEQLRASLPFKLTNAQDRVFREIAVDLASTKPLHRLVQGDVGSGKTIVALMAFLIAIENNFQCAMMAPTEILAEQHYRQFQRLLTPLGLKCALVVGKQGQKERREVRASLLNGQINIAVGTHALIEDNVEFQNLGLIIIDEQHRFGVKQRARLKAKSQSPELLTMTATPIPRTLALTMHGDLDVSEIDEMPPGRKPIETKLFTPGRKIELWTKIHDEIAAGRQVYIVFPLIEESETLSAKAATQEYEKLREKYPDLRFGLMHGKLKPQEKDEIMEKFRDRNFDILVCTTVIEVGVDVPNASVMVIENADRFGLAALHQLRGRVGRGAEQSYCYLVSDSKSDTTRQRLEIMTQTNDGFVIAEKDLEIRGPGEFLGFRQSGLPEMLLADLVNDAKILEEARHAAIEIIQVDPELNNHPTLKEMIESKASMKETEFMRSG